jgi:hypothetical protein
VPTTASTIWALGGALWLSTPVAVAYALFQQLRAGAFPTDADAIAIPIFGIGVLTLLAAPFYFGLIWVATRQYQRPSLTSWNRARTRWSVLWTIALTLPAGLIVCMGLENVWIFGFTLVPFAVHCLLDAYFLLVLRACVVSRQRR